MFIRSRRSLLGAKWSCSCGKVHEVPTQKVLIEAGTLQGISGLVEPGVSSVAIVSDRITHEIAGRQVADLLGRYNPTQIVIPAEKAEVDDRTAEWVTSQVGSEELLISCGSGSVTDLTKYAAFKKGRPFIAVATAPSMNGYASGIVAITEKGLKKTVPATSPVAVICDLDILCNAPLEMIRAGLGDVISKPVSMADWKLSSIVKGEHFCPVPFELIADLEAIYTKNASLIPERDPKVIAALTEALVYSGISMVIAGSSAPASGGEHLISHTLDMRSALKGRTHDLHGAQVGICTLITSMLYEELFSMDPDRFEWKKIWDHDRSNKEGDIKDYWGPFAGEVLAEFSKKQMTLDKKEAELERLIDDWDDIAASVGAFLRPSSEIKRILTEAGAKTHYSDIGASAEDIRRAIVMARTMRSRYTILDLADDLNVLEPFAERIAKGC